MKRAQRSPSRQPGTPHRGSRANPARDLAVIIAIADHRCLTQRQIAADAGIAVSLANQSLQRLAREGLIHITRVRTNRLRYALTAWGEEQRVRLAHAKMCASLAQYREVRGALRAMLEPLLQSGRKRIALYGSGEVAELAYLLLKDHDCEVNNVFETRGGGRFLGLPVQGMPELRPEEFESIVITLMDDLDAQACLEALAERGVSSEQIVTILPPGDGTGRAAVLRQSVAGPPRGTLPPS